MFRSSDLSKHDVDVDQIAYEEQAKYKMGLEYDIKMNHR